MSDALRNSLQKATTDRSRPASRTKTANTETRKSVSQGVRQGRGGHHVAVNPHTKRITLDVTPDQDRGLARFALDNETKKNPVLRGLIEILDLDKDLQHRVLQWIEENRP